MEASPGSLSRIGTEKLFHYAFEGKKKKKPEKQIKGKKR